MNYRYVATVIAVAAVIIIALVELMGPADDGPSTVNIPPPPKLTGRPILLELGSAGTCMPCRIMAPILAELKREQAGRFDVFTIDVSKDPDASQRYEAAIIPEQIFYDSEGKAFFRHYGMLSKTTILSIFRKQGVSVAETPGDAPGNTPPPGAKGSR